MENLNKYTYEGNIKNGQGKITYANGDTIKGEFKNNKLDGQGEIYYHEKRTMEKGLYKNGLFICGVKNFKDETGDWIQFDNNGNLYR